MNFDVEADWQLLNTCNYRCDYCFFTDGVLGEKLRIFAGADEWERAFGDTGLRWLIHMTGGEPSAYPGFADLCQRLTRQHFISINSNMTNKSWEAFAGTVDPSRVSFINAGLHLIERERKNGTEAYLRNVRLLRDRGFKVLTSLVSTPAALARFKDAIELMKPIGMFPIPKALRGGFEGRTYPEAYSERERAIFRRMSERARDFYAPIMQFEGAHPTIDIFNDSTILHGNEDYSGRLCQAGNRFFRIDPNGDVFRCGPSKSYGNIVSGTFRRSGGPAPCDTSYCFYFCEKYSQKPAAEHRQAPLDRHLRTLNSVSKWMQKTLGVDATNGPPG